MAKIHCGITPKQIRVLQIWFLLMIWIRLSNRRWHLAGVCVCVHMCGVHVCGVCVYMCVVCVWCVCVHVCVWCVCVHVCGVYVYMCGARALNL